MIFYIKGDWSLHSNCFMGDNFYNFLYIYISGNMQLCSHIVLLVLKDHEQSKILSLRNSKLIICRINKWFQVLIIITEYGWGLRGHASPSLKLKSTWSLDNLKINQRSYYKLPNPVFWDAQIWPNWIRIMDIMQKFILESNLHRH